MGENIKISATNLSADPAGRNHAACVNTFRFCLDSGHNRQANRPTNHKKKPTQITADAVNVPRCYAGIPYTSVNCSLSHVLRKWANLKLETLDPNVLFRVCKGFLMAVFRPNIDAIQFFLCENSALWFRFFLSNNDNVCINLFTIMWVVFFPTSFKLWRNLLLYFYYTPQWNEIPFKRWWAGMHSMAIA
jgi:hypothetical protein